MERRDFLVAGSATAALAGSSVGIGGRGERARAASISTTIPNVQVVDQAAHSYRFYDDLVKGRVVSLNFMFTTCGETCPLVTQNLCQVQDLLDERVGRDIFMYSLTLQPEDRKSVV